jgi:hypothetical protein
VRCKTGRQLSNASLCSCTTAFEDKSCADGNKPNSNRPELTIHDVAPRHGFINP